jgi:hypothetical protein
VSRLALVAQARHAAIGRLVATHADEFERLLTEERAARGLSPRTDAGELAHLRARVSELEAQLQTTNDRRTEDAP